MTMKALGCIPLEYRKLKIMLRVRDEFLEVGFTDPANGIDISCDGCLVHVSVARKERQTHPKSNRTWSNILED